MKKHKDIQPWAEYFQMLLAYERSGYLQMEPDRHEAYATQPAFMVLAGVDETKTPPADQLRMRSCTALLRRLRVYAACLAAYRQGLSTFDPTVIRNADSSTVPDSFPSGNISYLRQPFALHVVQPEKPHDLLYTLLIERKRRWWTLKKTELIDVIEYDNKNMLKKQVILN